MSFLFEYNNSLTDMLCETIIESFDSELHDGNIFNIPKNSKTWGKIERMLYKELLVKLNETKLKLLENINMNNELLLLLNKSLYTKHITIQKIDIGDKCINNYNLIPNRYNVLTYIFYLNDIMEGGELIFNVDNVSGNNSTNLTKNIIKPTIGKLVLLQEDIKFPYICCLPKSNVQYIISGQLCYDNIL